MCRGCPRKGAAIDVQSSVDLDRLAPRWHLEKTGGGVGFMSYIAFAPGRNVGVFLAVNRVDFAMFSGLTEAANALIASLVTR